MAPHWTGLIIIAILLLLLFGGRGKISALMGDFAKGITSFRKGLKDDGNDSEEAKPAGSLSGETKEEERTGS
ncbi:Sec-independent protein translocase TatA [Glycocaulis sp.]